MDAYQNIQQAIDSVVKILSENNYSISTIKTQRCILNSLLRFMKENNYSLLTEEVGIEFIHFKTGIKIEGFWGRGDRKINLFIKPVQNLFMFIDGGNLRFFIRSHIKPFECPECFSQEYRLFQAEYKERNYANATIICNNNVLHKFIYFLRDNSISSPKEITANTLTDFLTTFAKNKSRYIATVIYVLRNYLFFIYSKGITEINLADSLPHVRIFRNAFIPHSWATEDVKKLLSAIDRGAPKGKRDFAILLLVVRFGLRVSDIRRLELSSLNWTRKTISLTMQKTGKPIELPILDDVGWAIIDYLKNGRPQTSCTRVFVRHRAPFDAVGENESFYSELHRYMQAAGIKPPEGIHCGLHSLRSTLARNMLEMDTPLPIISEVLGHQSINTTSIYLKIDVDGLRKCPLDPEAVLNL